MSAPSPSRRRVKKRFITFTLVIEAQEMIVTFQPNWSADYGHFEFRSPFDPPRQIPVSETGYRSYFAPMEEIEASPSPQEYARAVALAMIAPRHPGKAKDDSQLSLF